MISARAIATSATIMSAALVASSAAFAQGKSQQAPGKSKGTTAPSRIELAAPVAPATVTVTGTTPLAWIDDASLLSPGVVSLSMSALRWTGSGASEIDFPVVDVALGLAPRLQLSASVPRVVGSADTAGAVGGMGTSFFSAKVALYEHSGRGFKVATAPTMQVLGDGVVASLEPGASRVRWGLPFSAEISQGSVRLYGGAGYFSPGLWFTGAAVGAQATKRTFINVGFSRAWRRSEFDPVDADSGRNELSGGLAWVLTPSITAFGSVGHTLATLPENGAGTSIVGGVSLAFATAR